MTTELTPGIYDISPSDYHLDALTPEPSLSRSGIVTLLNETPAHFKARHPRLTDWPDLIERASRAKDLGSVVHSLVLGKGAAFKIIELADFVNKDGTPAKTFGNASAKAAKEHAEAQGFIVLDGDTYSRALAIADSVTDYLKRNFGGWPIGESEVPMFWQRDTAHGRIWCRGLMDHFSHRAATILDVKVTGLAITDEALPKRITDNGAYIQAAWYLDGAAAIYPDIAKLLQFQFIYVEAKVPHQVRRVSADESLLTRARFQIEAAADKFASCLRNNTWPGYAEDIVTVSAPSWQEERWLAEELESVEGEIGATT